MAFASYGEQWRQARKVCVLELLSARRVESFQHVRDEEVGLLVQRVREACAGRGGAPVNLSRLLVQTSNDVVSRCVLGGKSGFGEVTRKVMVLLTAFCVGDALPWLRWVDALRGFRGELRSTFEKLDVLFDKVIEEHREKKRRSGEGKGSCEKDFVDILLQLQQDDTLGYGFTMNDFKAILLVLFLSLSSLTFTYRHRFLDGKYLGA